VLISWLIDGLPSYKLVTTKLRHVLIIIRRGQAHPLRGLSYIWKEQNPGIERRGYSCRVPPLAINHSRLTSCRQQNSEAAMFQIVSVSIAISNTRGSPESYVSVIDHR